MQKSFKLENARRFTVPTRQMYQAVLEARKEKIRNKTRERDRARRGYYNTRTLKRMRQGLPAPVMLKLSPKAIHEDMVVRSPSQVGYVAKVKKSRGMKLTRPPPWDPEAGYPELREELGHLEKRLAKLNKSKRTTEDIPDDS